MNPILLLYGATAALVLIVVVSVKMYRFVTRLPRGTASFEQPVQHDGVIDWDSDTTVIQCRECDGLNSSEYDFCQQCTESLSEHGKHAFKPPERMVDTD